MKLLAQSLSNAFGVRTGYTDASGARKVTRPQHDVPEAYRGCSEATRRAIRNYGAEVCREAYRLHAEEGNGASTIGLYLTLKTNQADAAINAGAEMCGGV